MRYYVLGVTEVRSDDGTLVPLGGPKVRTVLAALAAQANRPVPAETLIAEVWADAPPTDAPGALQALIARLRRTLGRAAITSEPGGYRLNTARDAVDLHAFETLLREGETALAEGRPESAAARLERALALWRGPALADLPERETAAARPDALRLTARRLKFDADLALGRATAALPGLREAVAAHPLDEPFHAQLIRALRAEGRTADALVAYDAARTVLAETLGTDPGPELRALHAELLRQQEPGPPPGPTPGPGAPKGNLRARLTSFVGRESELTAIRADIAAGRLVTLTGPGGSGKTRLSLEAAEAAQDTYPDGVWLAELAPLDDPSAIPHAVLSALGRRDTLVLGPGRDVLKAEPYVEDPMARLLEHCAHRRLLLVLDNCEHLIAAAAHLTAELLAECPAVTVLATSREPLGVPGEVVRPVEPLPQPTAYRLFDDRARSVRPGGNGYDGPQDEAAVREICRRLDGLPLAIELAAARLRALSPRQIADRLDDRFRLLTAGSRTLLPRQQTLRAVVDWSWDLLDEPERATLRALSVFSGGCTLAAAEAVCGPDALDTVAQLVDKSLLVADHGRPGGARYRLLETIQEYATERAHEHPAARAAAAARHTAYFRELARTADLKLRGADQLRWLDVLETELDNIRAALHRTVEARDEANAIVIVLSMGWFWWLRNYRDEASSWLDRVAALGGDAPTDDRADAPAGPLTDDPADDPDHPMYWPRMNLRMLLFFIQADNVSEDQWATPEAQATAARLAEAYRRGGPHAARFPGLLWPFTAYVLEGNLHVLEETNLVVDNCRAYGGDWELAAALMFRVHVAVDSPGGIHRATDHWEELAALDNRLGDRWIGAQVHTARAEIEAVRGEYPAARADFEAAIRLGRELGAASEGAFLLGRLAELAHRGGDDEEAHKLLDEAEVEAERFAVFDARTYIRYLRGLLHVRSGAVREAREMHDLAAGHIADGTPPPMFRVLLADLSARITAAEGDPRTALAMTAAAARTALDVRCTEPVVAAQFDTAAQILASLGDLRSALLLASSADTVRGPLPRTVPEQATDDAVRAAAASALPEPALARARAEGAGLSPEATVTLLARLAGVGDPAAAAEPEGA